MGFDALLTDAQTALDQLASNPQSLAESNPSDDVNEQALALGLEECGFRNSHIHLQTD